LEKKGGGKKGLVHRNCKVRVRPAWGNLWREKNQYKNKKKPTVLRPKTGKMWQAWFQGEGKEFGDGDRRRHRLSFEKKRGLK